jgi:phosphopantothenoylcysteine synthetase/decarboxylase
MSNVLVTSGGTKIPIDDARHIGNMSSGTFASKLADAFLTADQYVTFLRAEGSKSPFTFINDLNDSSSALHDLEYQDLKRRFFLYRNFYREIKYKSFEDYQNRINEIVEPTYETSLKNEIPDIVILAAAVSDYGVDRINGKIRSNDNLTLNLKPLPKVIATIKEKLPNCLLVGFKLLIDSTEKELIAAAADSMEKNSCDIVVANDLRDLQKGNHIIRVIHDGTVTTIDPGKEQVPAVMLSSIILEKFNKKSPENNSRWH